jgi:hypothetical protein
MLMGDVADAAQNWYELCAVLDLPADATVADLLHLPIILDPRGMPGAPLSEH